MAKPKSVKLRSLIMIRTLFKHSDAKHPIGFQEMNEHLRPYALDCDRRALNDTIEALEEFGINVSYRAPKYAGKAWIEETPFSDQDIGCIVFALTTNPHISQSQAEKILEKIKPFVTVYQEPLLTNNVEFANKDKTDDSLWEMFSAIQEAISKNYKIQYTTNILKYDKDQKRISMEQGVPVWFSPRRFYRVGSELFVIGFKRSSLLPQAIKLKDITSVRMPNRPAYITDQQQVVPMVDILSEIHIPNEQNTIVYQGPVTFRCRGRYVQSLCLRFRLPSGPVNKSNRSIVTCTIEDLTLTSDDLHRLSHIPGFGIRIIGPENAVEAVKTFYDRNANDLVDPIFPSVE